MAISQRLEIRQGQSLVMTPQLQQAIKLLQLSNIELAEFVETELEKNPLLERDDREERSEEPEVAGQREESDRIQEVEISDDRVSAAAESSLDADADSLHPDESVADKHSVGGDTDWSRAGSGKGGFDDSGMEDAAGATPVTLKDHLLSQLSMAVTDAKTRLIGSWLAEMVEEDGYLRLEMDAAAEQLGVSEDRIEGVIQLMQGFEPTGVMARSLQECLALQLKDRNRFDPAMEALVENLPLLARHDYDGLREACGVDSEDMNEMIAELRALTPKPGHAFGAEGAAAIEPDVMIREKAGGGWAVELNSDTLPRVLVNSRYYAEISGAQMKDEDKAFISECHANASWLVKSLDQRARTILKVASEIVRQQDAFFVHGVEHLRPLNLKTVADAIEMHESTVSRVTSNKYAATPRGLFELKYFFTSSIPASDGGEGHSAEAVRHRIKAMIDAETPDAVLSDDRIVEMLGEQDIKIARRTVAKYREAMRIPSSVQRRRLLKRTA
ncbi:MAG: RNA polymerase factor sigma-54 [Euryhalocaulis sp.]|uniref:RNA polymerase factor sigma-54 n=1 Tax=Euryhalocaulis sp. TaxID=2744307 RepID=UPI0018389D50|nr:RNA polymerase factor sigma-54 [Euryhalocaulis sp.]MBA4802384.1 RNA polymerase factor sigma-54 [Euryhalocaulis sp.]